MKNLWCNPRRVKPSVCVCEFLVSQSCPPPWDATDSSQPCSCLSGFSRQEQKWMTTSSFRGSSQPGDGTQVSRIAAGFFSGLSHQEALRYFSTLIRCLGNRIYVEVRWCPLGSARSGWSPLGSFRATSAPLGSALRNPRQRQVLRHAPHTPRCRVGVLCPAPHDLDAGLSYFPSLTRPAAGECRTLRPSLRL